MIWKHCLRNALIPVLTLWGVFVGNLITGAIVTETVFAWPGIGRLTYEAVIYRDFPLLQAVIILKSILILAINLGVDILYAYVDPRIRLACMTVIAVTIHAGAASRPARSDRRAVLLRMTPRSGG